MISCLTVTQSGRATELARAIACFQAQTLTECELVIVHDSDLAFDRTIHQIIGSEAGGDRYWIHQVAPGHTLGELRNRAVDLSHYPIVCQWDDDDLYHPRRLELQFAHLQSQQADFCFLTDQLHLFEAERVMFWDDWKIEPYPMNLIQGTLMGYKCHLGRYPALARGEDTPVVVDLVRRGCRIAALSGMGWLYVYVYNGKNAWSLEHHTAISAWKRYRGDRLRVRAGLLQARLAEYQPAWGSVQMPFEGGSLDLHLGRI